jgi:Spy/CpxP family protein refolding chaperone
MRRLAKVGLTLGVSALLVATVVAQQPRQGGRGRGGQGRGGFNLLANADVQKELKITDEQKQKIEDLTKKLQDKFGPEFRKLQDLSQDEQREKRGELMRKQQEETNKGAAEILNADQVKRYKQIQFQSRMRFMGPGVLNDAEVQKHLNLNDDQKDKIKTISEDYTKDVREIFQGGGGNFQENAQKMNDLRKEAMKKVESVLNDEQKKTLKDLSGAPFELRLGPPGGGGGRRRPRNDQ